MKKTENRLDHVEVISRESLGATPFDDAFKTEVVRLKQFLVPLINELFDLNYDVSLVEVAREPNEHYKLTDMTDYGAEIPRRLSDSCLKIDGRLYHVECQSTTDGDILVRLVEYNMQIGLENAYLEDGGSLIVNLPRSSLLMLRKGTKGGNRKTTRVISYRHEGQEIRMEIPVLNVQAYSEDDIYARKLYFLIPFYAMRYENAFRRIAKKGADIELESDKECARIYSELDKWFTRLKKAYENREISEDDGRKLAEISRVVLNALTMKLPHDIAERMVSTVGGKVLELQEDRWLKQGEEKGENKAMRLIKATIPGSDDYNLALNGTSEERQRLYKKYGIE